MPIQQVAISNTFNEFRISTNLTIDEVNKLSNGTANLVIDTITANTFVGVSSNLTVTGNTGSDVVSLGSENLRIIGTNGITTSVASNTVSVNLGSSLSVNDITLSGGTANTLVYLNASKALTTLSTLSFNGTNLGINNASPAAPLDIKGALRLTGSSTGYVGLQAASSGTNVTYTLPASDGLNGQILQTNGTGTLSWINQASGGGGGGSGSGTSTSRTAFTSTGGQTTYSVTYAVGQVDVYMNGSKLIANTDFTANNGTTVVLAAPAIAGDIVEAVVYSSQWITTGSNLYYSAGNIGVGTTSPAATIHAASANTAFAIGTVRIDGADSAGTVNAPVTINAATGGGTGNGGSQLYFQTRAENGSLTERLRLDHTGKVGIGTAAPSTTLQVFGTVTANTFSGSGASLTSIPNSATTASSANGASLIVTRDAAGSFIGNIITATTFSGSGSGLTSIPNSATTSSSANGASTIVARDAAGSFIGNIITATTFSGSGASLSSINATSITTGTVGTARLATGTANSSTYLRGDQTWATITGGATLTNDTATNASTYYPVLSFNQTSGALTTANTSSTKLYYNPSTGTLNSTVFNSLSDSSVKTDVKIITNSVDTINKISGVEFLWKETQQKSAGVIAQELESVIPHLVATDEKGMKSVNYNGIIAYLIQAVKELSSRVNELEQR
jgi:hypothetical protein